MNTNGTYSIRRPPPAEYVAPTPQEFTALCLDVRQKLAVQQRLHLKRLVTEAIRIAEQIRALDALLASFGISSKAALQQRLRQAIAFAVQNLALSKRRQANSLGCGLMPHLRNVRFTAAP